MPALMCRDALPVSQLPLVTSMAGFVRNQTVGDSTLKRQRMRSLIQGTPVLDGRPETRTRSPPGVLSRS